MAAHQHDNIADIPEPEPEPLKLLTLNVANVLGVELAEVEFDPDGGLVTIAGNNGAGKAQPLSEPVLTPTGWRTMGDIQPGDQVVGGDGKPVTVLSVHPQTEREVWKVTFSDGSWTRCSPDHLWTVSEWQLGTGPQHPARSVKGTSTRTLAEIAAAGLSLGDGSPDRWEIPLVTGPVWFDGEDTLPIDPWELAHSGEGRWIAAIERVEDEDCQCITVDASDGLYLTRDCIVTHNSSLLNAVWLALAGGAASRGISAPVKRGENFAYVRLELGDGDIALRVTREWDLAKRNPTKLVVSRADGIPISRPQDLLDSLIGAYSFDPFAFAEANDSDRAAMYLEALGVDVSELEAELDARVEQRRVAKISRDDLEARVRALPSPDPALPDSEVSNAVLLAEFQAATGRQSAAHAAAVAVTAAEDRLAAANKRASDIEEEIRRLQEALTVQRGEVAAAITAHIEALDAQTTAAAATVDDNLADLETRIADNESVNQRIRDAAAYRELDAEYQTAVGDAADLEFLVAETRAKIRKVIASAEAPIEGLSYHDRVVYFGADNLPFSQACESDKLRVSLAFAMALNPTIRIIRCEGSRIDENGLRIIDEMTRERGFQVLMERVGVQADASVVIEAGRVVPSS